MKFVQKAIEYLSTGPNFQGPLFPYFDSTYISKSALQDGVTLGQNFWMTGPNQDAGGNAFQWVKTDVNLVRGQLVALAAAATGTVTAAGSTVAIINTNITTTANQYLGGFIYFADIAATRRIKAHTTGANASFTVALPNPTIASKPNDPDVLASVPANGSAITITNPYNRIVCTATLCPVGVALGTVTASTGPYTLVQTAGLAEVLAVGSVTATVYGVPAAPGAGGTITGWAGTATALTGAAADLYNAGAAIIPLHAWAGASQLVPCLVNFTGA